MAHPPPPYYPLAPGPVIICGQVDLGGGGGGRGVGGVYVVSSGIIMFK